MRTIYKYQPDLDSDGRFHIDTRLPARTLSVQSQQGVVSLWLEIDTDKPEVKKEYIVVGTGHPMNFPEDDTFHVGTVQWAGLVLHVYEVVDD